MTGMKLLDRYKRNLCNNYFILHIHTRARANTHMIIIHNITKSLIERYFINILLIIDNNKAILI